MKLNRDQITKALECCITNQHENCCNLGKWHEQWNCMTDLMKNALALIKELTEENEKLTINMNTYGLTAKRLAEDNERLRIERDNFEVLWKDMKARNKDLFTYNDLLAKDRDELEAECDQIKADTVRKMQARIEKRSSWFVTQSNGIVTNRTYQLTEDALEQIVKEILEDECE